MPVLKIGIIGAGEIASSVHLPILTRRTDLFEVVAIADLNLAAANTLANRFNIPASFDSTEAMIAGAQLDLVAVLNSGSHAVNVIKALEAGLDVFCEKPLAYSQAEMNAIESAVKSSGKKLMIGYMKTFDPAVNEAQSKISGRPRTVDVLVLHPSGASQMATTEASTDLPKAPADLIPLFTQMRDAINIQALGEEGASAMGNLYSEIILGSVIHEFSVLRALDIHITEVDHVDRWPREGQTESIIIHGRTRDGVRVTVRWFYLDSYPAYREEVRWVNEFEGHHIIFASPYIMRIPTEYIHTTRDGIDHKEVRFNSYQTGFERELESFHRNITGNTNPPDAISAGREDLELSQKIARVIFQNEKIPVGGELVTD
jgi:predicted dehydrogenase